MATQAQGPAPAQVQQPVHPIHEEQATLQKLTELVSHSPDNDPHEGTELEEPQAPVEAKAETPEVPQEKPEEVIEFDEETPFFELEYNGKKEKLSAKQIREGYLAKQDYHRNIQKVKAEESQLQERVRTETLKAQQEYVQRLEAHKQAVQQLAGVKSLQEIESLSKSDPAAAQQEFLRMISMNQTLQSIENEQRQASQKLQVEQQAAMQQAILKARETLESDIPGWNEKMYNDVLSNVSKDYGFEGKDVASVYDARLIKVFHDAYQYRQLQRAKPEVSKRVVAVPKVVKPGSAEKPTTSTTATDDAAQRLKKSGRGEDFVEWYAAKLKQQKRK